MVTKGTVDRPPGCDIVANSCDPRPRIYRYTTARRSRSRGTPISTASTKPFIILCSGVVWNNASVGLHIAHPKLSLSSALKVGATQEYGSRHYRFRYHWRCRTLIPPESLSAVRCSVGCSHVFQKSFLMAYLELLTNANLWDYLCTTQPSTAL